MKVSVIFMNKAIGRFNEINYVYSKPDNFDGKKKYPVILLLHGAGSRGDNAISLFSNPFYNEIEKLSDFGFMTAAPQCPCDKTWFDIFEQLISFAEFLYRSDLTDQSRFYCMGASMGGYGTWQLGMSRPDLFAAIVPICGGGMYWNADRLKNVPVHAFHGALDTVVFPEESRKMVDAVNKSGGNAKLTIYPENDHDAWSDTYRDKKLYDWLLSCTNTHSGDRITGSLYNDSNIYG